MRKQKPFVINHSEEVEKYVVTQNGKYFYDESTYGAGYEGISRGWRGDRPPGGFLFPDLSPRAALFSASLWWLPVGTACFRRVAGGVSDFSAFARVGSSPVGAMRKCRLTHPALPPPQEPGPEHGAPSPARSHLPVGSSLRTWLFCTGQTSRVSSLP